MAVPPVDSTFLFGKGPSSTISASTGGGQSVPGPPGSAVPPVQLPRHRVRPDLHRLYQVPPVLHRLFSTARTSINVPGQTDAASTIPGPTSPASTVPGPTGSFNSATGSFIWLSSATGSFQNLNTLTLSATDLATVGSLVAGTGNFSGALSASGALSSSSLSVSSPTSNSVVLANLQAPNLSLGISASINLGVANIAIQHYLGESTYTDYLAISLDGASGDTFYVDGAGAVGTGFQTLDDGSGNMTVYGKVGFTTLGCSTTASFGQQLTVSRAQNGYSTTQILLRDAAATGYNMALGVNGDSKFGCVQVLNGSSYYPLLQPSGGSVSTTLNTLDNGSGAMTVAGSLTASSASITNGLTAKSASITNGLTVAGLQQGIFSNQIVATDSASGSWEIFMGVSATGGYGVVQVEQLGTGYYPLKLNSAGGGTYYHGQK